MRNFQPLAGVEETRIRTAYAKRHKDSTRYSWLNDGHLFFLQERERQVLATLKKNNFVPLAQKTILDIGCGSGYWIREFIKWGGRPENIVGVELLSDRVAEARRVCPQDVRIQCRNAVKLDFPNDTFDLVIQSTVFTSILDRHVKQEIATEMIRVLKRNGLILWYDFRFSNPWNHDVRGVDNRELRDLFPGCQIKLRRVTLIPPLARLIGKYSWLACYLLGAIPWLCTHYLGIIRKPS